MCEYVPVSVLTLHHMPQGLNSGPEAEGHVPLPIALPRLPESTKNTVPFHLENTAQNPTKIISHLQIHLY